jgi:hypothetical protein
MSSLSVHVALKHMLQSIENVTRTYVCRRHVPVPVLEFRGGDSSVRHGQQREAMGVRTRAWHGKCQACV